MDSQIIIDEAMALPIEKRAALVDMLLQSLNPGNKDIDQAWAEEAERRLNEIHSGKVQTISAEALDEKISQKLRK